MTRNPIADRRVVLSPPDPGSVFVQQNIAYFREGPQRLNLDLYRPSDADATPRPAVLLVTGYADPGGQAILGCKLKEMAAYCDWARLIAGSGMVAVTYENHEPVRDARRVLGYVRDHAIELGVDARRIGLWSVSGNVPNALELLRHDPRIRCAALCYGYLLDSGGDTAVQQAAAQYGFANPTRGLTIADLPDVPLLIVRAGRDEFPGLNDTLDRFVSEALAHNFPLGLINQPSAPHAFDIMDPSEGSKTAIRQVLAFFATSLS